MRRAYVDNTAEMAIGFANKEWKQMVNLAIMIKERRCDPVWAEKQEAKFTGIYKRLLTDSVEELKYELRR